MIRTTMKVTKRGDLGKHIAKIEAGLKGKRHVKVGFPAGSADPGVINIAVWNHFGTSRGIPPRPFLTTAIFKGRGQIRGNMRKAAVAVVQGKGTFDAVLPKLGIYATGLIQDQISSNMPPPNKPSTVRQKGSSATLIDSGRMRASVTWKLD